MKLIRKYYKYIRPYQNKYVLFLFFSLFLSMCTLPIPLLISKIIDDGISNKKTDSIICLGIGVISVYALKSLFQYWVNKKTYKIGNEIAIALRTDIVDRIQHLSILQVEKDGVGRLVSLIMNDVSVASNLLTTNILSEFLNNCFMLIVIIVLLFSISWKLTFSLLLFVPFYYFISRKFNYKVRIISKKTQKQSADVVSMLTDILTNQKIIRAYNSENVFRKRFASSLEKLADLHNSANCVVFFLQQLTHFLVNVSPLIVIWFGIYLVINGEMTIGILIAYYQYIVLVFAPFNVFMNFNVQYQTAHGALSRIDELMTISVEVEVEQSVLHEKLKGNIKFENVSFSYLTEKVLHNVNFSISSGDFVAIVGPSGSGKTTITNLMLKFYEPNEGEIFFDDINSNKLNKRFLRSQIGLVTQEPYLLNSSIKDNILISKPDATEEEVIQAAKLARIHEYIIGLEDGYNTIINERGNNLSGGQKQRISLARVFLQNPPIVIFDEATSALDSRLESMINETLFQLTKKSTCIVVSHRIAAISGADKILVVQNGEIVESGKHEELIKERNIYYDLYCKQISGELSEKNEKRKI